MQNKIAAVEVRGHSWGSGCSQVPVSQHSHTQHLHTTSTPPHSCFSCCIFFPAEPGRGMWHSRSAHPPRSPAAYPGFLVLVGSSSWLAVPCPRGDQGRSSCFSAIRNGLWAVRAVPGSPSSKPRPPEALNTALILLLLEVWSNLCWKE